MYSEVFWNCFLGDLGSGSLVGEASRRCVGCYPTLNVVYSAYCSTVTYRLQVPGRSGERGRARARLWLRQRTLPQETGTVGTGGGTLLLNDGTALLQEGYASR